MSYYNQITEKYEEKIKYMLDSHSKVMQIRFDLHYPNDGSVTPDKNHLYQFNTNLSRYLNRETCNGGHLVDPQKIWVEEQVHSPYPHYHYVLLVNGNAKRDMYPILKRIEKLWGLAINHSPEGLVNYCNKTYEGLPQENGIVIRRGSSDYEENINKCSHQAQYLAKDYSKDKRKKGAWLAGSTRFRIPISNIYGMIK